MIDSALYIGRVIHHRLTPKIHRLSYPVFQLLLDLDEAPGLGRSLRLFSHNRLNLLSFHDRDHGGGRPKALRGWIARALAEAGIDSEFGSVSLLAMPRVLGFVFNPLSVFLYRDAEDRLAAVIYEVNNTYGERHHYVLPVEPSGDGRVRQSCGKTFRVSPFMAMDTRYAFDLHMTGEAIRIAIDVNDAKGKLVMSTCFVGARRALTDRNLFAAFVRIPLLTLKVVGAIHLEALKLWLKGAPLQPAAAPVRAPR